MVTATAPTAAFVQVEGMTKRGLWKQRLLKRFSLRWLCSSYLGDALISNS